MQLALYARVSTTRQTQTIDQHLTRLRAYVEQHSWTLEERHMYRDDGYSGASLTRPGLDALRDRVALAEIDLLLITAPDRLARNYVHQVLLLEEFQRGGCRVEFLEHPMSQDPHDQLLLQRLRQDSERTRAGVPISSSFTGVDRAYAACSSAHTSPQRSWKSCRWSARENGSFMY